MEDDKRQFIQQIAQASIRTTLLRTAEDHLDTLCNNLRAVPPRNAISMDDREQLQVMRDNLQVAVLELERIIQQG